MKKSNGWHIVSEGDEKYANKGDDWVSIVDTDTVRAKANFVKDYGKYGLFGVAIYSTDYDDANNVCGYGAYPLLNEVRSVFTQSQDFEFVAVPWTPLSG